MHTSLSWPGETTGEVTSRSRDPETRKLVRQSLELIIQSEKVLTQLEDHLDLLRTFVDIQQDDEEATDDRR